jgi:ABC-type nitrate/sulfonate/bicarbonate transport system permease component
VPALLFWSKLARMKAQKQPHDLGSHLAKWTGIGMALGMVFGATFHQIGLGIAIGVAIGAAIGSAVGANASK